MNDLIWPVCYLCAFLLVALDGPAIAFDMIRERIRKPDCKHAAWETAVVMHYPNGHMGAVYRIEECAACHVRREVRWRDGPTMPPLKPPKELFKPC